MDPPQLPLDFYTNNMLPEKISATNIELLVRNPFGFEAKNILQLRKLDNVFDDTSLSKFGNFIHQIIEEYTLNYNAGAEHKLSQMISIGQNIIEKNYAGDDQVNLFWPKFESIAKDFIEFDEDRRQNIEATYPEIYGEIQIPLKNKTITITAIADRIDVMKDGSINILDYKTGTLPSKADIDAGISSQMIIEALITNEKGFKNILGTPKELIYVKFGSTAPYISTQTIIIDEEKLRKHKEGLVKILSYYDEVEKFEVNHSLKHSPKYDDYRHLARKE